MIPYSTCQAQTWIFLLHKTEKNFKTNLTVVAFSQNGSAQSAAQFQDKIAEHMKSYLGPMLYTDPVGEDRTALPSPEELKHKILIKAKKLPPGTFGNSVK